MITSLSNLDDNLSKRVNKIECKDCDFFLEYESVKDNLIKYKCLSCRKDYSNIIDEELKKDLKNTFSFSNNNTNKFILLLRKGVYQYEYMDEWGKFNETSIPGKEDFYSNLDMEDVTDKDCMHAKGVCQDFEIKNAVEYHKNYEYNYEYHYLKSDTLLLANAF